MYPYDIRLRLAWGYQRPSPVPVTPLTSTCLPAASTHPCSGLHVTDMRGAPANSWSAKKRQAAFDSHVTPAHAPLPPGPHSRLRAAVASAQMP
jgi:hypothetical protein